MTYPSPLHGREEVGIHIRPCKNRQFAPGPRGWLRRAQKGPGKERILRTASENEGLHLKSRGKVSSKRLDLIWSDSTRMVDGGKLGPGPGRAENQGDIIYDSLWLGSTTRWPSPGTAGAPHSPPGPTRQLMESRPDALLVTSDPLPFPLPRGERTRPGRTRPGHCCLLPVLPAVPFPVSCETGRASPPHSSSLMAPNGLVSSTHTASQPITPSN